MKHSKLSTCRSRDGSMRKLRNRTLCYAGSCSILLRFYNATSPISLIKQATCALFAASATRQKSLLLPWLGSCPYCCAWSDCCWNCCCACADACACACACEVGACDCGNEVDVRCRCCGCVEKYWDGWLAEGEGRGAEDEEVAEVFEEAMEVKVKFVWIAL